MRHQSSESELDSEDEDLAEEDLPAPPRDAPWSAGPLDRVCQGGKYLIICALSYDPPYKTPYK